MASDCHTARLTCARALPAKSAHRFAAVASLVKSLLAQLPQVPECCAVCVISREQDKGFYAFYSVLRADAEQLFQVCGAGHEPVSALKVCSSPLAKQDCCDTPAWAALALTETFAIALRSVLGRGSSATRVACCRHTVLRSKGVKGGHSATACPLPCRQLCRWLSTSRTSRTGAVSRFCPSIPWKARLTSCFANIKRPSCHSGTNSRQVYQCTKAAGQAPLVSASAERCRHGSSAASEMFCASNTGISSELQKLP